MNKYLKKNINTILSIFIIMQPILDLITGLCLHVLNINLTFGIIIRVLFLALIMYIIIFSYKQKHAIITYSVIIGYSLLYTLGMLIFKNGGLFQEIQGLVRTFYFPLLLTSLYFIKDDLKISKMTLMTSLVLYLILIFFPIMFNVGYKTYEITKVGTLGFFNSANEISGIISLLTPIMFVIFRDQKKNLFNLFVAIMYLVVILTIGTKTPIIALFITSVETLVYFLIKETRQKKYKPILLSFLVIIIGVSLLALIIPKTNFYKNIKTHLDYLNIKSVNEIVENPKYVDHFIFSQRLTFLNKKAKIFEKAPIYQKLFGIGYINNNKTTKLVEIDYFDILFSHGLIGFIIIFLIYILVVTNIIIERRKFNYDKFMIIISSTLAIILAFFTGHIITAPSVSLLVVIILLNLRKREKNELLFTANTLDIGGIETSLINLLKNIDYSKYNATVILEKKEGVLLSNVPKNVNVLELKVSTNKNFVVRKLTNMFRKFNYYILNYNLYDFSCCYATYSFSGNVIARMSSRNSCFYVHSDYKYVYDNNIDFHKFFDERKVTKFRSIVFVSNEAKESFTNEYKNIKTKLLVLNNFIDVDKILKLSKEKISEKKNNKETLLVFVGRLDDSSKKLSRAITLIRDIENTRLWVVGSGPDEEMYKDLVYKYKVLNRVNFLGRKENPYPYMNKADYIILTSDYEGFPVTYLEALTLNKRIITTIATSDDSINMNDYAYIISKDQEQMTNQVKEIISNNSKQEPIDIKKIQNNRKSDFEKLFNGVI